jgi:hypothetical protein
MGMDVARRMDKLLRITRIVVGITIIRYNEGPLRKGFHAGITRRNHPFRLLFNYRRDARRRFRLLFFLSQFEIYNVP